MMNKTTWQRVKLGEIAEVINGYAFKSSDFLAHRQADSLPIIKIKNVANGDVNFNDVVFCRFDKKLEKFLIQENDILISLTGNHPHAKSQVVGQISKYRHKNLAFLNQRVAKIITKKANKDFLYFLFKWKNTHNDLANRSSGSGNQANISSNDILNLEISLPPFETQHKIAEILSSLDDKIDLLHRQNKTLESLALTLFRHTFIDNPNRNAWQIGKLGDYVTPKKGKNITHKNAIKGIYPVIAGGLEPAYYHNQSNTQSPVITISASGANAGFVNIHYCPVWSSDSSYIDSTITPYIYISYLFLKHNQNILYDKQEGSAQPHIYPSHIMELEMPHYPKELVESFETQIQVYFNKISHNMKEIQNLESLRDIMLPKLLSGEMEV